jgi:hypothetical protein
MKSTQKGNMYEKEVRDILEAQGNIVEGQHRKVMWIRDFKTGELRMIMAGRDIYGCDLIVKKQGTKTRWIQVSTVAQKSAKQKQVLAFPWTLEHEDVELWLRIEGKRAYRVFRMLGAGAAIACGLKPGDVFSELEQQECVKVSKGDKCAEEHPEGL